MIKIFAILLLFKIGHDTTIVDTFDMVEVNHYHNDVGAERWSQLIFWDWDLGKTRLNVHYWKIMKGAYEKTKEGENKWNKRVRDIADNIKNWENRKHFLDNAKYHGEFIGGKLFPVKNYKSGYYEIIFYEKYGSHSIRRKLQAKTFRETHTTYDVEVFDRKKFHQDYRRGLTEPKNINPITPEWLDWQNILKKSLSHP